MGKGKTVLLVVIALVVLGLLVYLGSNQPSESPDATPNGDQPAEQVDNGDDTTTPDTGDQEEPAADEEAGEEEDTGNQLPPAVFNTSGSITSVGSDYIMIQSDGSHMESGEEVEVTVNVTDSTNILDAANNNISISDLSSGTNVSVEASGNIKNQTEIEASNIKISE